jgi:HEAT repeat protein
MMVRMYPTKTSSWAALLICCACSGHSRPVEHPAATPPKPIVEFLAEVTAQADDDVRRLAFDLLGRMGTPAVPHLVSMLDGGDEERTRGACRALGDIGPAALEAVPALVTVIEQRSDHERATVSAALVALRKMGPEADETVPLLVHLLDDPELDRTAGSALEKMGPAALEALLEVVRTGGDEQAQRAMDVLHDMDAEGFDDVLALASDPDPLVRSVAAGLLSQHDEPTGEVRAALIDGLHDDDETVAGAYFRAVRSMGPAAVPVLRELLKDEDHDVAARAADMLGARGGDAAAALPDLALLLSGEDESLARAAARAIGEIGVASPASTEGLLAMLGPGAGRPFTPLLALVRTGASEAVDVDVVAHHLSGAPLDVSILAARVLGNVGPAAADRAPAVEALVARLAGERDDLTADQLLESLVELHAALDRLGAVPPGMLDEAMEILPTRGPDDAMDSGTHVSCSVDVRAADAAAALPLLARVLVEGTPSLRCAVGRLAEELAGDALALVAPLADVLPLAHPQVQRQLLEALAAMGPAAGEAGSAALALAASDDPYVASEALAALGAMEETDAWPIAFELFTQPDQEPRVSSAAFECMQALGPPPGPIEDAILAELGGDGPLERPRLLSILDASGPGVLDLLVGRLLGSDDPEVRLPVLSAIASMGSAASPAVPQLVDLLDGADRRTFSLVMAVVTASRESDPDLLGEYVEDMEAPDATTRMVAMALFTDVVMSEVEELEPARRADALAPMLEPHAHAVPLLAGTLADEHARGAERVLATFALGAFGPLAVENVGALQSNLEAAEGLLQTAALLSLGRIAVDPPWSF